MRAIEITTENASALRELLRQSVEAYATFENVQKRIRISSTEMTGPLKQGEIAALCKDTDRIAKW
jgi:hypothetical protein